ncbi:MAG TPA: hypothetical protein VEB59_12370 [Gemmatimonadales bacterium]|nr:hypothetical protein [Gemmatimonadales bacterium]
MPRSETVVLTLLVVGSLLGAGWLVADTVRIAYTSAVVAPIERVPAEAGR